MRTVLGKAVTEEEFELSRPVRAGAVDFELRIAGQLYAAALSCCEKLLESGADREALLLELMMHKLEPLLEQIALFELERYGFVMTLRKSRQLLADTRVPETVRLN
jgi:hypothetical protein